MTTTKRKTIKRRTTAAPKEKVGRQRLTLMQRTLRQVREAFCVKLSDGSGFIVWPRREVGPRGAEMFAIGFGTTAALAWKSAFETVTN